MPAWWSGSVTELQIFPSEQIIGALSTRLVETHPLNRATQIQAWRTQIVVLANALANAPVSWQLLLEYPLLRLGKRIDAVLLTDRAIFVLEFKTEQTRFERQDREQAEDYALDLADFHAGSRHHPIIPLLIVPKARAQPGQWPLMIDPVSTVMDANAANLRLIIDGCQARIPNPLHTLDAVLWEAAPYRPVPNIVDAAKMLYARHGVAEIAAARADIGNLTRTCDAILAAITAARAEQRHQILFVTGIPGAGKTLCGLNTVFGTNTQAAFLTGNLPLVHVMRAALERDARAQGRSLRLARQETESAIQPLMGFLRDNLRRADPPHEQVIVFDEAQRAWDAAFGQRKFGHAASEAALFLDIMARHRDWAVIIALVGNGQEINTGEAGLSAWGDALAERPEWRISAAPSALHAPDPRQRLFATTSPQAETRDELHLNVSVRSIRSALAAPWVEAVLSGDAELARQLSATEDLPFFLTRDLAALRKSLRQKSRGSRRAGLVCSASARRLQADGIWPSFPHLDADAMAHWFLSNWPDVRASNALEIPATQFACQGLELDYVGLCWGNDLLRQPARRAWVARKFAGTRWLQRKKEADIAFQTNTYRVLLTRARYETIIWVPHGDPEDATRPTEEFDAIADFLLSCGVRPLTLLPTQASPSPVA